MSLYNGPPLYNKISIVNLEPIRNVSKNFDFGNAKFKDIYEHITYFVPNKKILFELGLGLGSGLDVGLGLSLRVKLGLV